MATCLIALGSNLDDRRAHLDRGLALLRKAGVTVQAVSAFRETEPVGGPLGQNRFLNACARLQTSLGPRAVLALLGDIERKLGRQREARWGPRTLDLDLLLYDEQQFDTADLQLPHPRLCVRRFVLEPAVEVAGGMRHPDLGWTLAEILDHVNRLPNYAAVVGPPGIGKSRLGQVLASRFRGHLIADTPNWLTGALPMSGNTPGTALTHELEFLQHRMSRLAMLPPEGGPAVRGSWYLSDFWLGQSLAYGRIRLPDGAYARLESAWQEAQQWVQAPKLLVFCDLPAADEESTQENEDTPFAGGIWIMEELRRHIHRHRSTPVLRVCASSLVAMVGEVGAALQALQ